MQRIDFYQQEFRPLRVVLPLRDMLRWCVFVLLLLLLAGAIQSWRYQQLDANLKTLKQREAALLTQVEALGARVAARQVNPALHGQVLGLREQVRNQQHLLDALSKQGATRQAGFSAYLQALMDHHVPGIALARVGISDGGARLSLGGSANAAGLLPVYVEGLKQADALQGLGFSAFDIKREEAGNMVLFELGSRADESEKQP